MIKTIAVITDIHGNLEALESIIGDIKKKDADEIICLGDTISFGANSKECLDLLIDNNVKMVLGNHELYILRGVEIDSQIKEKDEIDYFDWVRNSLTDKEISFLKKCPLTYECTINYKEGIPDSKLIFSHYLINDTEKDYPFEPASLNRDINLWIKHNEERNEHIIGHLHKSFDPNEVEGIFGDFITATDELANINVLDSAGCTLNDETSYLLINIVRGGYEEKVITLKYDREKFLQKLLNTDFPNKKNILKYFYGIVI